MTPFAETYLGRLRALVGSQLILMPGAQVVLFDAGSHVLMQRRADSGQWEFPSGSAERGQSFADIAITELAEEAGVLVREDELEPFACLSDPKITHLRYSNGDQVQAFALCFVVRVAQRPPAWGADGEAAEHTWWPLAGLPTSLDRTAGATAAHLRAYLRSGSFQVG
mgnify:CR=1 FL=1